MALVPVDEAHALQIQAGILGRRAGHQFEDWIAERINSTAYPLNLPRVPPAHLATGDPGAQLLLHIGSHLGLRRIDSAQAISTGALATSDEGRRWLTINGANVSRCKSDLVLTLRSGGAAIASVGVSTKQCNHKSPTNAQLYFTTANGFARLLRRDGLVISDHAVNALRSFCGEPGFRPTDNPSVMVNRQIDPRRFFWEELSLPGRSELEAIFRQHQARITRLLLQKAYLDDAFTPDFLLHKTRRSASPDQTEVAILQIDQRVQRSGSYQGFATRPYSVHKCSFKDPPGVAHLAPRFGIVQMQRGGQRQQPEQLRFNLEAGYFYRL